MQDFRVHLEEQLDFLRASCDAFDAGREHEAKRLATTLRLVVHDTGRSTSLLTHLGVKDRLGFVDTAPPDPPPPPVITLSFGLAVIEMVLDPLDGDVRYIPALRSPDDHRAHPPACFYDWWTSVVLRDQRGNRFSRKDLVLALANQDGGAHIDATLKQSYAELKRSNSVGFSQGGDRPISNSIVHASVRQIAFEMLRTIEQGIEFIGTGARVRDPICPLPSADGAAAARNDPCPCGSGVKAKKCFGRRRPRLALGTAAQDASRMARTGDCRPGEDGPPRIYIDSLILEPVHSGAR